MHPKRTMPTKSYTPGMLRGKCTLHDAGDLHAPFAIDAILNHAAVPFPVTLEIMCNVNGCSEEIKPGARNDCRRPLCEYHKRAPKAQCADGTVVCFCFYCNKTHGVDKFTIKTNICDRQYLRRKERN